MIENDFDLENALLERGFEFDDENPEKYISYKKDFILRIVYDAFFNDDMGRADEISLSDLFYNEFYRGRKPKDDQELDELIKRFS